MLRLTLFGGFALFGADGAAVVIASRKCRALLAYLALQRQPVTRERLAWLLWGDGGEARARGSLRQALATLRREIPGDGAWLLASAETIAVDRQALWVDAINAQELLSAGDPVPALEMCGRGELLAGFTLGAAEFDEWREGEQRWWREREAATLRTLLEQARKDGHEHDLLALGRRLLKLEPWNEEAHRAVMQALAALGRYSEALRQYQTATEALRAELGIAPGPATERLLVDIRGRRATRSTSPADAADVPAPPPPDAPATAPTDDKQGPVGREVEAGQIEGLLQGCRASGRGHVILIRGEAGMGKTTLLSKLLERARAAGFATHVVQVNDYGAGRNADVVQGVLHALDAPAHTPPSHRLAVDELLGNTLDTTETAVADALEPDARAQAHTRAVEALVAAAGTRDARIIAIEDLHWCDAETTRILCALAAAAPQHRLITIFTCRSGEEPADLAWAALVRRGSLTSIDLGRLNDQAAAQLAARYPHHSAELTRRCIERAGGHPLFLVQLLDSGAAAEEIPQSVQAAVLARLGRVSPADRQVLDAAAVLATPFTQDQMARLLKQDTVDPTPLVQRGWLQPTGTRLSITHDLVAAAIRSALDAPTLARLHRWAAEWFAARDPLTSAEHLERAGDPGAAAAYLSVAREALRLRRLDVAANVLERMDACAADPVLAFEAACLRGDVRRERGDAAGSHAGFSRAESQARSAEQQARIQLGLAAALRLLDRHDEALVCVDKADALTPADDHGTRAQLQQLRGNLLFVAGDLPGCQGAHESALQHARQADSPAEEAAALSGLGDAAYLAGRLTSSRRAFEACRQLARSHGFLRMETASELMLAMISFYANDVPPALASAARAIDLATQIADLRLQTLAGSVGALIHRELGDWAATRVQGERTQTAARQLGSERLETLGLNALSRTALAEGRQREALGLARQAFALCQRGGGPRLTGPSILSTLALAESDPQAASAAIARGEELLPGCPCHNHFDLREAGIRLALARGAWDEARRHAAALEQYLGDEPTARGTLLIEAARALAELGADPHAVDAKARVRRLHAQAETAGLAPLVRLLNR